MRDGLFSWAISVYVYVFMFLLASACFVLPLTLMRKFEFKYKRDDDTKIETLSSDRTESDSFAVVPHTNQTPDEQLPGRRWLNIE